VDGSSVIDFEAWCAAKARKCPKFSLRNSALLIKLAVVKMVGAMCEHDFSLYCQSLIRLARLFFASDHRLAMSYQCKWMLLCISIHGNHSLKLGEPAYR
jgi:hypothetical protein